MYTRALDETERRNVKTPEPSFSPIKAHTVKMYRVLLQRLPHTTTAVLEELMRKHPQNPLDTDGIFP